MPGEAVRGLSDRHWAQGRDWRVCTALLSLQQLGEAASS
jgi:hypothetical protein